ncbi:MAG: hypothetical protein Q8Q09_11370 [Deltaproteobacteria bacterium]|nr:hypothetical protein [Deltaproteobacteria bacterium]
MLTVLTSGVVSAQPRAAAQTSSRWGYPSWIRQLSSADPALRSGAIRALVRYAPADEITQRTITAAMLEQLQRETDPQVELSLVRALPVNLLTEWRRPLLAVALEHNRLDTAAQALAFARIGPTHDVETFDVVLSALALEILSEHDASRRAALASLAQASDTVLSDRVTIHRANAPRFAVLLEVLGLRSDARWSTTILEHLESSVVAVRIAALRAAADLALLESAPLVIQRIERATEDSERQAALRTLGVVGGVIAAESERVLRDQISRGNTALAMQIAAQLGLRNLVDAMLPALGRSWSADRLAAAESIATVGGPTAATALTTAALREPDAAVRRALWTASLRADLSAAAAVARAATRDVSARWAWLAHSLRGERTADLGLRASAGEQEPAAMALNCLAGRCEAALASLSAHNPEQIATALWAMSFAPQRSSELMRRVGLGELDALDSHGQTALLFAVLRHANQSDAALLRELVGRMNPELAIVMVDALSRLAIAPDQATLTSLANDAREPVRATIPWVALRTQDARAVAASRNLALSDPSAAVQRSVLAATRTRTFSGGQGVGQISGLEPFSVWAIESSDHVWIYAMVGPDGTLLLPRMASAEVALWQIARADSS